MSNTTKTPDVSSAASTARVISRLLRKNGFKMADTSDRFRWTEGFHVHRIGYGKVVSIDYHTLHSTSSLNIQADRQLRREQKAKVREFLIEKGYPLDPRTDTVYVNCERE